MRNTEPPFHDGSPDCDRGRNRRPRENRRFAPRAPAAPHHSGSASDAPRRGAARSTRWLHGRLRRAQFWDACGEEIHRPVASRRAASDPDHRRGPLDRRARHVHGDDPVRARPQETPNPRRGRARDRRRPDPEPRDPRRQRRQRISGRRHLAGTRGGGGDARPRERHGVAAGAVPFLLHRIPEERPPARRDRHCRRDPPPGRAAMVPQGRNARGAGDLESRHGGHPIGLSPHRARKRRAHGRAASEDGGGSLIGGFDRRGASDPGGGNSADRRPAVDRGIPPSGLGKSARALLERHGSMKQTLSPEDVQMVLAQIGEANRTFAKRYSGDSPRRQPVHTVYGGAQVFQSDSASKLGALARRALETYAPEPRDLAQVLGLPDELAGRIFERVVSKLEREPVEDFRIDFEDGYGNRPDAEEDGHAESAAVAVVKGMEAGTLPPFIGIRIKPFNEELRARSFRTLDIFVSTVLEKSAGALPGNCVVTLPKITAPEQVAALADLFDLLEKQTGLASGSLKMEMMIETTQSIINSEGRINLPLLLQAARGRCVAAHFGTYDYTASCSITAAHQHMMHPACGFAKQMMAVSFAGTGIWLSDGATNIMPVRPDRAREGPALTQDQI